MCWSRRRFIGAAAASLAAAAAARAGVPAGTSPRAWFDRWLAAFNAPDGGRYAAFARAHIPTVVPYLDDDLGVREASGGFTVLRVAETAAREVTAWVRDRRWDRFSRVVLTVGDGRIDDLSFAGAPPPADARIDRMTERDALRQLARKLRDEAAAGRFAGTVLVAKHGDVLMRDAYGPRALDAACKATPTTRYCIGSMGKMLTAVSVMQLVQRGELSLDDTIASRLPTFPDTPLARTVTIEHLLTHAGGTGDFFGPEYDAHQATLKTPADFIARFGRRDAAFSAGSRWGYSNFGFIVLGAIVEATAGRNWQDDVAARVFAPAKMRDTSAIARADDTAVPCNGAHDTGLKALPYYVGLPAGGGYSTIDDLHAFDRALHDGRLLDAKHLAMLVEPRVAAGAARWSRGLRVFDRFGAPGYGHGGSAPGVNADFGHYPASGYTVIVLSNRGHPHAVNVADFIGARLPLR